MLIAWNLYRHSATSYKLGCKLIDHWLYSHWYLYSSLVFVVVYQLLNSSPSLFQWPSLSRAVWPSAHKDWNVVSMTISANPFSVQKRGATSWRKFVNVITTVLLYYDNMTKENLISIISTTFYIFFFYLNNVQLQVWIKNLIMYLLCVTLCLGLLIGACLSFITDTWLATNAAQKCLECDLLKFVSTLL